MRINFDFNDLEAFLAVMETGSFHHAANRLNLSQSAVTRRIQKLEDALGSLLFERTTRAVRPTLAAKRLQARAEAILESAEETTLAMRDESVAFAHQRGSLVTVAMIPTVVASLLVPALKKLRREGNAARVRILDLAANEVGEAVTQGEADFGICSIGTLEPNTHFDPLFDDEIVLALPQGHPLLSGQRIDWPHLKDETLIFPARGTGNRLLIDEALARSRRSAVWTYEVGRTTTALDLVSNAMGVALLPRSSMNSSTGRTVACRDFGSPSISRPIGLLSRIGASETSTVRALKGALRDVAGTLGNPA